MHADTIRMLLAAVDAMQPSTCSDPHARDIHLADLPALLGISPHEAQLILDEADAMELLDVSDSGRIALTDLGRQVLAQSPNPNALTSELAFLALDI